MSVFEAVADPTRRQIIELVSHGEMPAGDIASVFDVSRPAISRHLRVLRESGLLVERTGIQPVHPPLAIAARNELDDWLSRTRSFWTARLDALEDHLGQRRQP